MRGESGVDSARRMVRFFASLDERVWEAVERTFRGLRERGVELGAEAA